MAQRKKSTSREQRMGYLYKNWAVIDSTTKDGNRKVYIVTAGEYGTLASNARIIYEFSNANDKVRAIVDRMVEDHNEIVRQGQDEQVQVQVQVPGQGDANKAPGQAEQPVQPAEGTGNA